MTGLAIVRPIRDTPTHPTQITIKTVTLTASMAGEHTQYITILNTGTTTATRTTHTGAHTSYNQQSYTVRTRTHTAEHSGETDETTQDISNNPTLRVCGRNHIARRGSVQ